MAKKEKVDLDRLDLDNELDFDNFLLDDIDAGLSPEARDKKSRSPVIDVFNGTISGAKSKFKDPSFLARTARKALPEQYEAAFSAADEIAGTMSSLYDEAVKEVKPEMARLARRVDKLVPEERKTLKKITGKLKDYFYDVSDNNASASKEKIQEQSIANSMAAVFQQQNQRTEELKARESVQSRINERIESKRFKAGFSALQSINNGVGKLVSYNDNINLAYQKKSLELQFRSYFIQSEQLQTTNRFFEVFKNQNDAIAKNTALPEFVKIKNSEKFREIAKGKFFDAVQTSFFGDNNFLKNAADKFKAQTQQAIKGFKSGVEGAVQGIDAYEQLKEQNQMLEDAGIGGISKAEMFGTSIGDMLAGKLGGYVSKKARARLPADAPLSRFGYRTADFLSNLQGKIKEGKESDFIMHSAFDDGVKGQAAKGLSWLLNLFETGDPASNVPGSGGIRGLDQPGIYNNRTDKSINEVIPGYLARIYREIMAIRTNDPNVDMTVYDYASGRFLMRKNAAGDVKKTLMDKIKTSSYGRAVDEATRGLLGDTELLPEQEVAIKEFISKLSSITMDYTPEKIQQTKLFRDLDADTASVVNSALNRNVTYADENEKGQFELTKNIRNIRRAAPDIKGEVELFIRAGYGDILEEQGIVKRNKNGSFDINFEAYQAMIKESGLVSSDENVKRNITAFKPHEALSAIKNTKIYNWFYKNGKGDQLQHTGPMAQDVNQNMGEQAAPDGTKIDLTTMNGINMSAIQGLQAQINKLLRTDSNTLVLKGIKRDTARVVKLLSNGSSATVTGSETPRAGGRFDSALKRLFGIGAKTAEVSMGLFQKAFDKGSSLSKLLTNAFTDSISVDANGQPGVLRKMFDRASEIALKVMDIGKDVIFNRLPAGYREGMVLAKKAKDKLYELIQGPIDLYVKGRSVPSIKASLLKMGYYIDQATGKIITSLQDIKGPVINRLNEVVLTEDDVAQGLVDQDGKPVSTPFAKLVKLMITTAGHGVGRIKRFYKNLFSGTDDQSSIGIVSKVKSAFRDLGNGFGNDKSYDVLVEIRDLLRVQFGISPATASEPATGASGAGFGLSQTASDSLKKLFKKDKAKDYVKQKKEKATELIDQAKAAWNDKDASGRRDGAWQDRYNEFVARNKDRIKNVAKVDLDPRYKGANIFDNIMGKFKSLADLLSGGSSGLFSKAAGIFESIGGFLGLGGKAGFLKTIGGKLLGAIKSPKTVISGAARLAGSLGTSVASGVGAATSMGTFAKAASLANTARTALTVGSLATGGVASAVMGSISASMTALAGLLGSPVVLSAVAIAAAGYGIYKAYQYLTRDDITSYETIRIKQYGLTNIGGEVHHNHEILQLEAYLQDGRVGYSGGQAYLNKDKINSEELLSIFSIDKGDTDQVQKFMAWFQNRFKPFFLTHLTALFAVNNKVKLPDIKKLKKEEQLRYLGLISFESGPYGVTESPFKDIEILGVNKQSIVKYIDELMLAIKVELDSSQKEKPARDAVGKTASQKSPAMAKLAQDIQPKPAKQTYKPRAHLVNTNMGEEGAYKEPDRDKAAQILQVGMQGQFPAQADGPVRDGEGAGPYIKLQPNVNIDGLNPALLQNFKAMVQEYGEQTGKSVIVTSGYRSLKQQEDLYRRDPATAAKPGRSLHQFGLALDVNSSDLDAMEELGLMRKYGFTRPVGGEPWHMEPAGIQVNLSKAKNDAGFAEQAIAASLFKGGGGVGTMADVPKGKRNADVALSLLEIGTGKLVKSDRDQAEGMLSARKDVELYRTDQSGTDAGRPANDMSYTNTSYDAPDASSSALSFNSGYAQSVKYSMNSRLPDLEAMPDVGGFDAGQNQNGPINSKEDVKNVVANLSKKAGVDPGLMTTFAAVESSLNPNARASSSSASGLFQFTDATWREKLAKYGRKYNLGPNTSPTNITASTLLASEYIKENSRLLKSVKPDINMTDLYLSHFLGPGGARKLLSANPNAIAATIVPSAAKSNRSIFYPNGRPVTVAQLYSSMDAKLANVARQYGIQLNSSGSLANKPAANDGAIAQAGAINGGPDSVNYTAESGQGAQSTEVGGMQIPQAKAQPVGYNGYDSVSSLSGFGTPVARPVDAGQGFSLDNLNKSISSVDQTLTKSLSVQEQMLDVLKQMAQNLSPEKFMELRDNMMKVSGQQSQKAKPAPRSAIDLARKSA